MEGEKKVSKEFVTPASTIGDYTWTEENFGPSCVKKRLEDYEHML
jgi:hypothetical protein